MRPPAWTPATRTTPAWSSGRAASPPSSGAAVREHRRRPSSWPRRSPGGCPSGPCWASCAHRALAGLAPPLRPGLRLRPEDLRPTRPVLPCGVHRRREHGPVRGGPAHRGGVGAGAVDGAQPAHRPEKAQRRDRMRGQRVRRAGRGQGVGRRNRGGRPLRRDPLPWRTFSLPNRPSSQRTSSRSSMRTSLTRRPTSASSRAAA